MLCRLLTSTTVDELDDHTDTSNTDNHGNGNGSGLSENAIKHGGIHTSSRPPAGAVEAVLAKEETAARPGIARSAFFIFISPYEIFFVLIIAQPLGLSDGVRY